MLEGKLLLIKNNLKEYLSLVYGIHVSELEYVIMHLKLKISSFLNDKKIELKIIDLPKMKLELPKN